MLIHPDTSPLMLKIKKNWIGGKGIKQAHLQSFFVNMGVRAQVGAFCSHGISEKGASFGGERIVKTSDGQFCFFKLRHGKFLNSFTESVVDYATGECITLYEGEI